MYRSSSAKWFNPEELNPPDSRPPVTGQGMQSVLSRGKSGSLEIQFKVPQKLAPVYLAFHLVLPDSRGGQRLVGPASRSPHFAVPIGLSRGKPLKYGEHAHMQLRNYAIRPHFGRTIKLTCCCLDKILLAKTCYKGRIAVECAANQYGALYQPNPEINEYIRAVLFCSGSCDTRTHIIASAIGFNHRCLFCFQTTGASLDDEPSDGSNHAVSFAVASRHATAMSLCIARRQVEPLPLPLTQFFDTRVNHV